MFNVIKLAKEAITAIDHSTSRTWSFTTLHLSAQPPRSASLAAARVYDAVLTIDEEVPETPLSDG